MKKCPHVLFALLAAVPCQAVDLPAGSKGALFYWDGEMITGQSIWTRANQPLSLNAEMLLNADTINQAIDSDGIRVYYGYKSVFAGNYTGGYVTNSSGQAAMPLRLDNANSVGRLGMSRHKGPAIWQHGSIRLQWNADANHRAHYNGWTEGDVGSSVCFFKKADFGAGVATSTVQMTSVNDTLTATLQAGFKSDAIASAQFRWVVQDAGAFYISAPVAVPETGNETIMLRANALQTAWYVYSPTSGVDAIADVAMPGLQDIGGVGFHLQATCGENRRTTSQFYAHVAVLDYSAAYEAVFTPFVTEGEVIVDAGRRHQKIEGFGASGAFYANRLINHSQSGTLANLLFRDLGLDIFRIRNEYLHPRYESSANDIVNTIRLGEAALGRPFKLMMGSWSPPASLKSTGKTVGGGTLASDSNGFRYGDFATWWADSIDYYEAKGIGIDFVSIQNEPNWRADYVSCELEPTETNGFAGYNLAFEKVWQEFASRYGTIGMPKMLAPEPISFKRLDEYIDALLDKNHVYGYAHHLYQDRVGTHPDALLSPMRQTHAGYGYKPIFQTEFAVLDANTNSAVVRKLNIAKLMHNALTVEEVSAYFYWALYWNGEQGLVDLDSNSSYRITPEYYAFKHYSAFIHSGWRRIDVQTGGNRPDVTAFIGPDREEISVVIINTGPSRVDLDMAFNGTTVTTGRIYQSTAVLDCAEIGGYSPGSPVSIPPESITTLALAATALEVPEAPNILMVAIDDLRPELRCYGAHQMKTPHLDQLASDGYQFNRAYVQQAVCAPSRASVMTGMRPDSTQVFDLNTPFRNNIPWVSTLPQYLSQNGYHSVGIGKIYHNAQNDKLSWDEPWKRGNGLSGAIGAGRPPTENAVVDDGVYRDGAVTDTAVAKLAQLKNRQPFFYGVGYVRPHLPFCAPKKYWDLYSAGDLQLPATDLPALNAPQYAYTAWGELRGYDGIPARGPVSARQERELIHGYYACVSYIDAQVGRLMNTLEAEGLTDSTIVVVWGDHGWHLGDHGQWTKHTNFERATRIPLIIKVPWMPGAAQVDALVEALDIYPTLLDLCGLEPPVHLEGDSLAPLLQRPASAGDAQAISQYPRSGNMGYSMRTDRYRYTEWRVKDTNILAGRELYDHFLDAGEDTNVVNASSYTAAVSSLAAQLQSHLDAINPPSTGSADQSIINGEFDAGLSGWSSKQLLGAAAGFTVLPSSGRNGLGDDPLIHIDVTIPGSFLYQIYLEQVIEAQAGKLYTIRFQARSEAERVCKIIWRNKNNVGTAYLNRSLVIGTSSRLYELRNVRLANLVGSDPDASIRFQVGGSAGALWLDSIEVHANADTSFGAALNHAGLTGANALAYADADGDGIHNLFEYAFNLNPAVSDRRPLKLGTGTSGLPAGMVETSDDASRLEIEYVRRKSAREIEYVPEFTGNLTGKAWTASVDETVAEIDGDWERVRARDYVNSSSSTSRFGRVRVLFKP